MPTKRITSTGHKTRSAGVRQAFPYHRPDLLLHTMRCIARYEDALCAISHEAKLAGSLSSETTNELHEILEKIPSHDYVFDLDVVKTALAEQRPSKISTRKKSARSVPARKRANVAKEQSRRKSSR